MFIGKKKGLNQKENNQEHKTQEADAKISISNNPSTPMPQRNVMRRCGIRSSSYMPGHQVTERLDPKKQEKEFSWKLLNLKRQITEEFVFERSATTASKLESIKEDVSVIKLLERKKGTEIKRHDVRSEY